jgi:predicted acylesterase/phospholipase RssA
MRATQATRLAALIVLCLTSLIALGACAPVVLRAPLAKQAEAPSESPETIRTMRADQQFAELPVTSVAEQARAMRPGQPFNILALSGGGADGAFGAGALVGLAQSDTLPAFSVVTGVSAGALIAPYAFLGPEWDRQLSDAYTSGRSEHLLQPRGFGVFFGSSAYRGSPLKQLVEHYLTDALVQALAREAASGRLLLVATTNVDTGESVVWDLGSIAMNGGARAKALLRDVLVASASVPGMFPPVIIRVHERGRQFDEAHVDGTATAPFLVPAGLARQPRGFDPSPRPTEVYVIVDGRLSEEPQPIQLRFREILSRSISAGLTHMMRTTLELTATSTELQGAHFEYAAIPAAYGNLAPFDFSPSTMRTLFQYGYDCAHTGRLWVSSQRIASRAADGGGGDGTSQSVRCPAEDQFIGRFAVR